ncbi:hypothetical protein, partial [Staphylococcus aureus]
VLNGDLFRFYKNPDFKKVNPSKYKYETYYVLHYMC